MHACRGDYRRMLDLTRGSVVFEQFDDLCTFVSKLKQTDEVEILRVKNRFKNSTASGYKVSRVLLVCVCVTAHTHCYMT